MHARMHTVHTYLHLLTLDSTSNDEKNGFQNYCGPSLNEKGFIIFNQHECELIIRGRFLFVNIDDSLSIAPGFMRVGNVEGKKIQDEGCRVCVVQLQIFHLRRFHNLQG